MMKARGTVLLVVLEVLVACGGGSASSPTTPSNDGGAPSDDASSGIDAGASDGSAPAITLMTLPIGDGKYGPTAKRGYVFSCQQTFMGGGAMVDGPWIHKETGTFDFTAKVVVQGSVSWQGSFSATVADGTRTVTTNGLPSHATGTYPIAASDPAYAYDRNPNAIREVARSWALPATPEVAPSPTCLGLGPIGVLLTGSVFFNALDAGGRDAVAHETQDACQAHPEMMGAYHYHSLTQCLADPGTAHSALLGYARDGFGIYGVRGEDGKTLTNADLDECHGHTHPIAWDGQTVTLYHYHATYEYPYTLGCFRGTPKN